MAQFRYGLHLAGEALRSVSPWRPQAPLRN
jgi:hypothetical protein